MTREPLRLRTLTSLAMIFTAITALFIFVLGMAAFYVRLQRNWVEGLSETNQQTLQALVDNGQVDPDALTTLVSAFSLSWSGRFADQEAAAVLVFVAVTIVAASVIGVLVARRLSRPIETVTIAANQVAGGAIDVQVDQRSGASLEARDLFLSFNQMTKALEQAERESTESAAAIAHELRTPLTVLRGRLQGLRDGAFDPSDEMLTALVAQVDTLAHIVDELGTLSKLGAGQIQPEFQLVNLAQEAKAVLTSVGPDLDRDRIQVEAVLKPAWANADPSRIRQALSALIDNVRQYAVVGRYLKVETFTDRGAVHLTVTDRGPGIAEQDRSRVFDRWWRQDRSRVRSQGGSGLGLSVVRAIVRAHNGSVSVMEGPDGHGAMFTISLPEPATATD